MRYSNQIVVDELYTGEVLRRNVRRASAELVERLGARNGSFSSRCTIGSVRLDGFEVPVVRTNNRRWVTIGIGLAYSA